METCPLCASQKVRPYFQEKHRDYVQCQCCDLVWVPQVFHLTADEEKAAYDHHQNDPADLGYRRFLSRAVEPLFSSLAKEKKGLDFGCGPGPTISVMAAEVGLEMENYDLYYQHQPELLTRQYDFITMTEVIEHIYQANAVLTQLDRMLAAGGVLAIMTKRVLSQEAFATWHYKHDLTHIVFYSNATFEWIAKQFNWRLEFVANDVVYFHKYQ